MCYSKEVQLVTGSTIGVFSAFYYVYYSLKYKLYPEWVKKFVVYILSGFCCIGGHQLFEFLSLSTGNQIIYKVGLLISISSMYFFFRSLEVLFNENIHSKMALAVIFLVAIHAFLAELSFVPYSFYLRHNSVFVWSSVYMLLFIYFHVCALRGRRLLKDEHSKRAVITYLLAAMDISFLLSVIYVIWGYFQHSVNVCTDSPSIWCTFYVVQVFAIPWFLSRLPKLIHHPSHKTVESFKETAFNIFISIIILLVLISTLPFFKCLSLKFVFP